MSYLGSKAASGAYQAIIANMPPHDTYIETHLGSGAIMRRKPPASQSIGVDIDPEVIRVYSSNGDFETVNADAVEFLTCFDFERAGRVLIYSDPPYLHSTRTSHHRYNYEYTDADHRRLLQTLRALAGENVMVMLSGYPSTLYDQALTDWRSLEFQVMTRGGPRTEKLWLSFDGQRVNWPAFAGSNHTDRQRIKRKAQRWQNNYRQLPPQERLALLSALLEVESVNPVAYRDSHLCDIVACEKPENLIR